MIRVLIIVNKIMLLGLIANDALLFAKFPHGVIVAVAFGIGIPPVLFLAYYILCFFKTLPGLFVIAALTIVYNFIFIIIGQTMGIKGYLYPDLNLLFCGIIIISEILKKYRHSENKNLKHY